MILSFIFGFLGGVAVASFFHFSYLSIIVLLVVTAVVFLYRYFVEQKGRLVLVLTSLFLVGFIVGAVRVNFSNLYQTSNLKDYVGQKVSVEGIIASEPDVREDNTKLTLQITEIEAKPSATADGRPIQTSSGFREKVLVTVPIYPEFSYGDKIRLSLLLQEPKNIESSDGRVFDYSGYLRARGIWYTSNNKYDKVTLISHNNGSGIKSILYKIKNAFTNALGQALPEPESSFMTGLLLGAKQSLGKELLTEFQRAGVSHVVVLSGYNIAIVANSIMSALRFLPQNLSFVFGSIAVILFTVLSGGGASAWRAAIMVLVALSAKKLNRDYKASRALGFAVVLMLAPNPLLLVFDSSFQLSVLATIGLIWVSPIISPYLKFVTEKYGLRLNRSKGSIGRTPQSGVLGEIVSSTIATQITVLPFLIYNTGILSLVSLPVNILILGVVPLTMFLGFLTGLVGTISLYLSFIPALFAYALLWYQLKIIHIGASLPFGAVSLPAFSPIVLVFIYLAVVAGLYSINKLSHK